MRYDTFTNPVQLQQLFFFLSFSFFFYKRKNQPLDMLHLGLVCRKTNLMFILKKNYWSCIEIINASFLLQPLFNSCTTPTTFFKKIKK
jgi:hypothetical protein